MDLIQLGARMRQEREARKLSLEDVMEATKISRRILLAFEGGQVEEFPHPVYAKGFVKNYAKLLGLDPLECVRILEREYCPSETDEERREPMGVSLKDLKDPSGKSLSGAGRPWGVIVTVLLLVVLLAGVIWYMSRSGRAQRELQEAQRPAAERSVTEEPATPPSEAESLAASSDVEEQDVPAPAVEPGETSEAAPEAAPGKVEASAGVAPSGIDAVETAQAGEQQATGDSHLLVISVTAKEACWVGVVRGADEPGQGQWSSEFMIEPGQSLRYAFKGRRTFRFGRLETVRLELDGKPRPATGSGVVEVTLP